MSAYTLSARRVLRHLAGQPMTRDEALGMWGAHAIDEVPEDAPPS